MNAKDLANKTFMQLKKENARLKADNAELLHWIEDVVKSNDLDMPLHNTLCELIRKHKESTSD